MCDDRDEKPCDAHAWTGDHGEKLCDEHVWCGDYDDPLASALGPENIKYM